MNRDGRNYCCAIVKNHYNFYRSDCRQPCRQAFRHRAGGHRHPRSRMRAVIRFPDCPFQFALSEKFLHGLQTNPAWHTPLRWYRHKWRLAKIRPV